MIVVSNTSPLTNLAAIGQFDLLRQLFGMLHIPIAVQRELSARGVDWPGAQEVATADWIQIHQVGNQTLTKALQLSLDAGETEAIGLALELQADLILLDEQDGRRAAQYLGLQTMGVVGLLVRAKQQGFLAQVQPQLDALRQQSGFYLSQSLYDHGLRLADEL